MALGFAMGALALGGMFAGAQQQRRAARREQRASELEQRRAAIASARQRKRRAAESRIQAANIQAAGAAQQGVSTGVSQAVGAVRSQTAGALSFARGQQGMIEQTQSLQRSAMRRRARAQTFQTIGQMPGALGFSPGQIIGAPG